MIHAYFTDGMFPMAITFLESFRATNSHEEKIFLSTKNLSSSQIDQLYSILPGVIVDNRELDFELFSKRTGLPVDKLKQYKWEVENRYVTVDNRVWKLMIAAEDRPRSLYGVLKSKVSAEPILHFDIDTLFLRDISPFYELASSNDLCLLLRPRFNPVKGRITISTIGVRYSPVVLQFFERWFVELDKVEPIQRPIGFGQTSCWYAFEAFKSQLKVHTLDRRWGYPGKNNQKPDNFIWSGAIHKLTKEDCVKLFKKKMGEIEP